MTFPPPLPKLFLHNKKKMEVVLEAWPKLPSAVRQGIVAIVTAVITAPEGGEA